MGWYNPCFHFCTDMFLRICLVFQLKFHYRKFRKIKKNSFISPDNSADFFFLSRPFVFSFSLCLTTSCASLNCSRQETQHLEIHPPYRFLFSVPRVEKKNITCAEQIFIDHFVEVEVGFYHSCTNNLQFYLKHSHSPKPIFWLPKHYGKSVASPSPSLVDLDAPLPSPLPYVCPLLSY